jgi:TonB family protein
MLSAAIAAVLVAAPGVRAAETRPAAAPPPATSHSPDSDADEDLPVEGTITNPDWVQLPTADELGRFYPPLARQIALPGKARMRCNVNTLGMLDSCKVVGETPAGVGFGAAALQLASYFRMRPQMVNGAPVGGASVVIPLNFVMGQDQGQPQPDTAASPAPSPRALSLGRRLADVMVADASAQAGHNQLVQTLRNGVNQLASAGQVDATQGTKLVDAYAEAYAESLPVWRDKMADYFARTVSEAELASIVTFMESPAGKVWAKLSSNSPSGLRTAQVAWMKDVSADARKRFCAVADCSTPSAVPQKGAPSP